MGRYPFPWHRFFRLALELPSGRADLMRDATTLVSRIDPSPVVLGVAHVPPTGPVVVAVNHYQRHGLWIGWPGAVITVAIAKRRGEQATHWLVTGALRWRQSAGRGPEVPFTAAIFRAVAQAYQMVALPLESASARAAAVRLWLGWLERGDVCAIFPEGLGGSSDGLRPPEAGFESLCRVLRRRNLPVVPCGVYERESALHIRFGEALAPDRVDAERVMQAIAELLPGELRGAGAVGSLG